MVMESHPARGLMVVTAANFLDWEGRVEALQDVTGMGGLEASMVGHGAAVRVIGTRDRAVLRLMGVPPAIGRGLVASDFRSDGRVVVIDHELWRRHFQGDLNVIGAPIVIDGEAHTVVGVMPRDFKTIGKSEIWIPWIMSPKEAGERRFHLVGVMARLRPSRTASDAQQELGSLYRQLQADHPDTTTDWTARVLPLRDLMLGPSRRALVILGAAILILVVVASINIAGLLLAWLPTRRREFLVRMALGAPVARVVRQLLVETLIWGAAGMAGGLVLALWFVRLFGAVGISSAFDYDFVSEPRRPWHPATTLLLVVIIGVAAIVPSVVSVRRARPRAASRAGHRILGHRVAIVVQVALSVLLLCATAGLLAGFKRLRTRPERVRRQASWSMCRSSRAATGMNPASGSSSSGCCPHWRHGRRFVRSRRRATSLRRVSTATFASRSKGAPRPPMRSPPLRPGSVQAYSSCWASPRARPAD